MAGVKSKPNKNGKYEGWYKHHSGVQKWIVGTKSRRETKQWVQTIEAQHKEIKLGVRPLPTVSKKNAITPIEEVLSSYIHWGKIEGGRNDKPWSSRHSRDANNILTEWFQRLGIKLIKDLEDSKDKVDKLKLELLAGGANRKTLSNKICFLSAFCKWCVKNKFLSDNPVAGIHIKETSPQTKRRPLSLEDIQKIIDHVPDYQGILYKMAICSGLRANELRQLTVDHLDTKRGGLVLDASFTKNRKEGFQPLPEILIKELQYFISTRKVEILYTRSYSRKDSTKENIPNNPLLYVPMNTARQFTKVLDELGIEKLTAQGKLDFHALRGTISTLVSESGAQPKEHMDLVRHSDPRLTFHRYTQSKNERLNALVDQVGSKVFNSKQVTFKGEGLKEESDNLHKVAYLQALNSIKREMETAGVEPNHLVFKAISKLYQKTSSQIQTYSYQHFMKIMEQLQLST